MRTPSSETRYTSPSCTSGDGTSGVPRGSVQTFASLLLVASPWMSGRSPSTFPFLAEGTTMRPGTATGDATKRSVALYPDELRRCPCSAAGGEVGSHNSVEALAL